MIEKNNVFLETKMYQEVDRTNSVTNIHKSTLHITGLHLNICTLPYSPLSPIWQVFIA